MIHLAVQRGWSAVSWVVLLVVAACATSPKKPARPEVTTSDYAPLRLGAFWVYDMKFPGQNGEMTVKMVGMKDGFYLDDRNGALKHTSDGLRDQQRYLIRHPLVAGNQWKTVVGPSALERAEIVSVGEPCQVAAGAFSECLVVHGWIRRDEKLTLHITWTWVKGVGLAEVSTEAELGGQGRVPQTRQSLKAYALDGGEPKRAPATATPPTGEKGGKDDGPNTWE